MNSFDVLRLDVDDSVFCKITVVSFSSLMQMNDFDFKIKWGILYCFRSTGTLYERDVLRAIFETLQRVEKGVRHVIVKKLYLVNQPQSKRSP